MNFQQAFFDELEKIAKEMIVGGKGDNKPISQFDKKEFAKGMRVEREHTKSRKAASEIARDHLTEDPHYYSKLMRAGLADELKKKAMKGTQGDLFGNPKPKPTPKPSQPPPKPPITVNPPPDLGAGDTAWHG